MKRFLGVLIMSVFAVSIFPTGAFGVSYAFNDLAYGDPSREAITYLKENGVVEGYADGEFKSINKINHAEFLKIIIGSLSEFDVKTEKGKNCFSDVKDEWFAKYVCFAKAQGIVSGYADGRFRPANNINFP